MSEIGIPAPPPVVPEPAPPISPEPPPEKPPVDDKGVVTPPIQPAPPVEPEIPPSGGGGGGFPDLLDLAALLLVLGIVAMLFYFTGLANFILRLVWSAFGRSDSAPQLNQQQLGQPVSNLLAPYVMKRDAQFGADFAQMGATVARVGRAILAAEETIFHAVQHFLPLEGAVANAGRQSAHLSGRVSRQEAAQAAQARTAAQAQVNSRLRADRLAERLTAVEAHVTALQQTQTRTVIPALANLEKTTGVAWDEIRKHGEELGAAGLALGVAAALGTLGAGWTRCDNNAQLGQAQCGLPRNLLKDLLAALTVVGAGTFTLVELAKWEKGVIMEAKDAVAGFWSVNLPHS